LHPYCNARESGARNPIGVWRGRRQLELDGFSRSSSEVATADHFSF